MYVTRYLIQSLLTGYAPCSISFKTTDSNPCLRKTNKKNYKTSKTTEPAQLKCCNSDTVCIYALKETDIMIKQAQNKSQSAEQGTTQRAWWAYGNGLRMSLMPEIRLSEGRVPFLCPLTESRVHAWEDRRRLNKQAVPPPLPRESALPNVRVDAGCSSC